ncbi:hypothetical protein [Pseudoalteromonas sp. MMG005]|uniref:hypothetical protein n=1 Tax=Pseudoalteromonas sp. MMG005 TaxID=2822682 RepID=UPI001B3A35D2|nr:hypothetical protein [Pseudoalteromonas sp. MMG005]MBQ4845135.1 hypothetical protein [Pseudoalteromonas sp. MMG005]
MTIMINQSEVKALDQLPDKVQTLIQLIPDGDSAFETLLSNQDENFSFNSADSFVEQLALGIRNSSLVLLPNAELVADIKKLLDLSTNDLRDLSYGMNRDENNLSMEKHRQLLQKYHLLNRHDFSAVNAFYKRNNLNDNSIVWAADFQGQITLQRTLAYCEKTFSSSNTQIRNACHWALSQAQNLCEFAHYYCIHLMWQQRSTAKTPPIDTVVTQLMPLALAHLNCPTVTFELDENTLNRAIVQWQEADNAVGFASVSAGLLCMMLHIDLSDSSELVAQAKLYITTLQKLLAKTLASEQFVGQAGLAKYYVLKLTDRTVVMSVDADGCLSIDSDRPSKKPTTPPANTASNTSKGAA